MIRRRFKDGDIPPEVTHQELVKKAVAYLRYRKGHSVVIAELSTAAMEIPDAIGFKAGFSTIIECKASRADFLADQKKPFRVNPERGMGYYRYYMSLGGLLKLEEIPDKWGFIEIVKQNNMLAAHETIEPQPFYERNQQAEITMLVSTIRRLEISAAVFVQQEKEE